MLLIVVYPMHCCGLGDGADCHVPHELLRHMQGVMFAGAKVPTTSGCTTDVVLFDATTGGFTTLSDVLSFARAELAAASSTSGTIALFGGGDFRAHYFLFHVSCVSFLSQAHTVLAHFPCSCDCSLVVALASCALATICNTT